MNVTTLERVKLAGRITGDAVDDEMLTQLIEGVSARIEAELDRWLDSSDLRTEYLDDSDGALRFALRGYPIAATPAPVVERDYTRAWTGAEMVLAPGSSYWINQATGALTLTGSLKHNPFAFQTVDQFYSTQYLPNTIRVRYHGGMAASDEEFAALFADITIGANEEVLKLWRMRDRVGITSQSIVGSTVTVYQSSELNQGLANAIARHRRVTF